MIQRMRHIKYEDKLAKKEDLPQFEHCKQNDECQNSPVELSIRSSR